MFMRWGALAIWIVSMSVHLSVAAEERPAIQATQPAEPARIIRASGHDLQQIVAEAPPNSVVLCDPNEQITLSAPLEIRRPLTLRGLNARLPDKLGKTSLVIVRAKGVTVSDFELTGNGESVSQDDRAPLMIVGAGEFRVEHGRFNNSSKDGLMIDSDIAGEGDVVGGVVRDIVGRDVIRDTVSISGSDGRENGGRIRNVLVDNIRCYHSAKRGCVEVSDGTDNITVRKVYAENSVYAVDVQDHRKPSQVNRNVVIEDVYGWKCTHAIRTDNMALGHANLTVRDVTARECEAPIQISNTENVSLYNVRVLDHHGKKSPVDIRNCRGLTVRDVMVENTDHKGPAMLVENCGDALVDGFALRGRNENLGVGLGLRYSSEGPFTGLRVTNVLATGVSDIGILLDATGKGKGTLSSYVIAGNIARVVDHIQGPHAQLSNNLP
jgi:hypothetical protein